ncbi:SepM family pheromone-processing serine protease [Lacticaseibacillus daqingensis]|uniref:SepM family pheromone-processing serine protease n=1 Tax=Lacticaseibacillus daqingensis TaxID=2486014 RepID=UPI000F79115C|nr:SepM family pheromone-processing serine protease [Lacticaseibacillus daqingensis]
MPARRHRGWRWALGLGIALAGLLALCFLPTNRYVEVPGSAESLKPYVTVRGIKDREKGQYMLTTVGIVGPASPAVLLWAQFQPYAETLTKAELMGSDSSAEYDLLQRYYIQSAGTNAIQAAFTLAKQPVAVNHLGIYVMSLLADSPFKGKLKLGDTITALDGHHYQTADAYVKAIAARKVGSTLTLTYTRAGQTRHATGKLMRLPGTKKAGIGITLTEHTTVTTTPKVTIDAGEIGGPSAGLMFALQTYTLITHQQLRRGQAIAGTGTIDGTGTVGQIGGIDKKVVIAAKTGAKVFFAPNQPATKALLKLDPTYQNNYAVAKRTAKAIGTKMVIVPVKHLQDAVDYLTQR